MYKFKVGDLVILKQESLSTGWSKGAIVIVENVRHTGDLQVRDIMTLSRQSIEAYCFEPYKPEKALDLTIGIDDSAVFVKINFQHPTIRNGVTVDSMYGVLQNTDGFVISTAKVPEIGTDSLYLLGSRDEVAEIRAEFDSELEAIRWIKECNKAVNDLNKRFSYLCKTETKKSPTIELKDKKLKISKGLEVDLSLLKPSQLHALKKLAERDKSDAVKYALSFFGIQNNVSISDRKGLYEPKIETEKYLKMYHELFRIDKALKPGKELGEYLGIEIECLIPRSVSVEQLTTECKNRKIKGVQYAHDGSIQSEQGFQGVEFRVITRQNDFENLKRFCKLLSDVGAKVNKSCGLHVHLDMRNTVDSKGRLKLHSSARRLGNALEVLALMQPASRRNNRYCQLGVSKISGQRYYAINKTAYHRHSTLEVRLHSGTINFTKIYNWCRLLLALKDCKKLTKGKADSVQKLFELCRLDNDLKAYVESRVRLFNASSEQTANGAATSETELAVESGEESPITTADAISYAVRYTNIYPTSPTLIIDTE